MNIFDVYQGKLSGRNYYRRFVSSGASVHFIGHKWMQKFRDEGYQFSSINDEFSNGYSYLISRQASELFYDENGFDIYSDPSVVTAIIREAARRSMELMHHRYYVVMLEYIYPTVLEYIVNGKRGEGEVCDWVDAAAKDVGIKCFKSITVKGKHAFGVCDVTNTAGSLIEMVLEG